MYLFHQYDDIVAAILPVWVDPAFQAIRLFNLSNLTYASLAVVNLGCRYCALLLCLVVF